MKKSYKNLLIAALFYPFVYFFLIASKITGDPNYKSNKNEFLALFLVFLIMIAPLIPVYISKISSGWATLEKKYKFEHFYIPFQPEHYTIHTIKQNSKHYDHNIRIAHTTSGFVISAPYGYGFRLFHSSLHIPWSDITSCKKNLELNDHVIFTLKNVDVLISIPLWEFFEPLCAERGLR